MKNQVAIILLCLAAGSVSAQGTWIQIGDFPGTGREAAVYFTSGGKGYVGTGYVGGNYLNDFWEFDPASGSWTQKADVSAQLCRAAGMTIGSNLYVGTGAKSGGFTREFFEYNTGSGSWTSKAMFGGSQRDMAAAFSIGNKGYIGTGKDQITYYKDFWEYDLANDVWTQKADLPGRERIGAVGFGIGNRGYLGLGYGNTGDYRLDIYEYYPEGNYWVRIPKNIPNKDFPGSGRESAVVLTSDVRGKAYVICGYRKLNTYMRDAWEYDQALDRWLKIASFPVSVPGRSGAVGFVINGIAYVGLGRDSSGNYLKDFWSYQLPTAVTEINDINTRIFPCPVHDNLTIEIDAQQANFMLFDLNGKKIIETKLSRKENSIPLISLPEGAYMYQIINSEKKISSGKILKAQ